LKKFPHLVQMHRELGPQGLVVMSVTTDEEADMPQVLNFLTKSEASFTNFLLIDADAGQDQWEAKYPVYPQPMLWIYNRSGERVVLDEGRLQPPEIEAQVKKLLAQQQ
jgi:hypothetical protein